LESLAFQKLGNLLTSLNTIHDGHVDVEKNETEEVSLFLLDKLDSFEAVGSNRNVEEMVEH